MAEKDVEVLKRWVDSFNRRNLDDYDDLFTADFEWFPAFPGTVEREGHLGREGIESYFGEISDTWEEIRAIIEAYRDLGDRVVAFGRIVGDADGAAAPRSMRRLEAS